MALPLIPDNLPPPQVSPEAPGTGNLPFEFTEKQRKKQSQKREPKRLSTLNRAGSSAFDRLNQIIGDESNKDVQLYNSLSQEDISRLRDVYGLDEVARYVKAMEKKRLNRS